MTLKPHDIDQDAWDAACEAMDRVGWFMTSVRIACARAIMAAKAEAYEASAAVIDANMLCGDDRKGDEVLLPRGRSGNKVGFAYAAAIRKIGNVHVSAAHTKNNGEI